MTPEHGDRVSIRRARPDDAAALAALCVEHAGFEQGPELPADLPNRLHGLLQQPGFRAWLAWKGSQAIGFASGEPQLSTWQGRAFWHLDGLYLQSAHRGRGLGARLLNVALDHAREHGLHWAEWQTPAWNQRAIGFYLAQGARSLSKARFTLALCQARPMPAP